MTPTNVIVEQNFNIINIMPRKTKWDRVCTKITTWQTTWQTTCQTTSQTACQTTIQDT